MSEKKAKKLKGRLCYGHLGGTIGDRLFERLIELEWFERDGDKKTVFVVTAKGEEELAALGVNIHEKSRTSSK